MKKIPYKDTHYWMDSGLCTSMDDPKRIIRKDWDYIYSVVGDEGSGKSVLTFQLAYYVTDGRFSEKDIYFDIDEFMNAARNAPKYSALVLDEAFRGLSSRGAMSKENKKMVRFLKEIRQRNLFLFFVSPSMWELDKYLIKHRSVGVFRVFSMLRKDDNGEVIKQRGYWHFYKNHVIKQFIANTNVKETYPKYPNLKGTFRNFYPIDKKVYIELKSKSLHHEEVEVEREESEWKERSLIAISELKKRNGLTWVDLGSIFGVNERTVRRWTSGHGHKDTISYPSGSDGLTSMEQEVVE